MGQRSTAVRSQFVQVRHEHVPRAVHVPRGDLAFPDARHQLLRRIVAVELPDARVRLRVGVRPIPTVSPRRVRHRRRRQERDRAIARDGTIDRDRGHGRHHQTAHLQRLAQLLRGQVVRHHQRRVLVLLGHRVTLEQRVLPHVSGLYSDLDPLSQLGRAQDRPGDRVHGLRFVLLELERVLQRLDRPGLHRATRHLGPLLGLLTLEQRQALERALLQLRRHRDDQAGRLASQNIVRLLAIRHRVSDAFRLDLLPLGFAAAQGLQHVISDVDQDLVIQRLVPFVDLADFLRHRHCSRLPRSFCVVIQVFLEELEAFFF